MNLPDWQWNEMQQVGTDYTDLAEVEAYDNRMAAFRDVTSENQEMLSTLNLPASSTLLEIGCGTGRFSLHAATTGLTVTAVDVSQMMLNYVNKKARLQNLTIATQHAGFLTMDLPPASFDAAVSGAALHHLPDIWKLVALRNIAKVLKPRGQFILRDVVFAVNQDMDPKTSFDRFVDGFTEQMRPAAIGHVKKEFSTYDWIMEGLLNRAGFKIISTANPFESFFVYHCVKMEDQIAPQGDISSAPAEKSLNKTPAYFLAEIQEVIDEKTYMKYVSQVPAVVKQFGGKYLSRGQSQLLSGQPQPGRIILLEFDSEEHLKRWWNSPEYRKLAPLRQNSTKSRAVILKSCAI